MGCLAGAECPAYMYYPTCRITDLQLRLCDFSGHRQERGGLLLLLGQRGDKSVFLGLLEIEVVMVVVFFVV